MQKIFSINPSYSESKIAEINNLLEKGAQVISITPIPGDNAKWLILVDMEEPLDLEKSNLLP